jgi:N-ethylmaleimide reductase
VTNLFDPVLLGDLQLSNRIVMAPMTRSRAGDGDVPTALNVEYYRQRATAGLIVSEGTQPSENGKGYCRTPGIHNAAQIAGWRKVTDAVHAEGGKIVLQIMHCGRIGAQANKAPMAETIAPSAIRAAGQMFTDTLGMVDFDMPRALETGEIPAVIAEFGQATENALKAGFDGVELHAASGYLPMQFLSTGTNRRTDHYGGSAENRVRAVVEMLEAMVAVAGAGRVGIRICPGVPFNDIQDDNPEETYATLLKAIEPMGLAYLHLILLKTPQVHGLEVVKANFTGNVILNDSITLEHGNRIVDSGEAAAVSFARYFLSNPDLVRRFREGRELAHFNRKTLYTPGPIGYTDYPFINE